MEIISDIKNFINRQPWRIFIYIMIGWMLIAVFNFVIQKAGVYTNTPYFSRCQFFYGPSFHFSGVTSDVIT
jgi:hypothetical protein